MNGRIEQPSNRLSLGGAGGEVEITRADLVEVPLRLPVMPSRTTIGIEALPRVGEATSRAAESMGLSTLADLLHHYPAEYRDYSRITEIGELKLGERGTVRVEVRSVQLRPTRNRRLRIVEATVSDSSGSAKAVWFNQAWLAEKLKPGTGLILRGHLEGSSFKVEAHEIIDPGLGSAGDGSGAFWGAPIGRGRTDRQPGRSEAAPIPPGLHTSGLVPIHPAGERVRRDSLREWIWRALGDASGLIEAIPAEIRARRGLPGVEAATRAAHFPKTMEEAVAARRRIAYEELFLHQLALADRRRERRVERRALGLEPGGEVAARWRKKLPFEMTEGQLEACRQIDADLIADHPMQRLLMGEVGSGKTVVALHAMLRALDAGAQAVLMAPTETLAEQHFMTLEALLAHAPVPAALLTGSTGARRRREILGALASGELGLVVGTHALIEPTVRFSRLAVAVIDEQHRFGVRQRAALDAKGPDRVAPHALHMTATPIPRTLSLTAYGDLEMSVLRELPAGRKPVKTWVVGEEKRRGAYEFLRERLREGRQAFVVCPLVSESDKLQARAATSEAERLAAGELRDFKVGVLHGQMPSPDKARIMASFTAGEVDVLVATSVIEVGIDVPNATVMVIEGADRYGLSQLHQLRGRVGRGEYESACILFADARTERATQRMEAIAAERDGFKLAETDLTLRGEGEVLGTRQHGLPQFRVADLPADAELLAEARQDARSLLDTHGSLEAADLGPLIDVLRERFGDEREERIAA